MNIKKRALSAIFAACLAMATAVPGFAATGDIPVAANTTSVSVANVESGATVKAYRIVEPTYNAEGFVKFDTITGVTIADIEAPTSAEITAIAQAIEKGTLVPAESVTLTGSGTTYSGDLKAGEYIVLVTNQNNANYVYNPMVISAYYTDANEADSLTAATADASGDFETGGAVYAKRTEITLDKTILNADGNKGTDDDAPANPNAVTQADDLGIGDTANFQIATKIPAYSDAYKALGVQYTIEDTQDAGLDAPTNIVVKVGGDTITASATTFATTITGNDFKVDFASDFALAHAGEDVVITYSAVLNENCEQKLDPNNNTVKLTYTNSSTDKSKVTELEDDVQEYTFPVQVIKVNEDEEGLEGAEFTLTRTDGTGKTGTNEFVITTDEDGIAQFDRLDEGTYSLKETKAPEGYAINPDEFEVVITPTYGDDGKLVSYKVTMKNKTKNTDVGEIVVDNADDDILAGNITDSKLQTLPSTGGNGTAKALGAAAILGSVTAALVFIGKKKKNSAED